MLRDKRLTIVVLLVVLLTGTLVPAPAGARTALNAGVPGGGRPVRLAALTGDGVTFEVAVPWEELSVEPTGSGHVQVTLPGWATTSQAGAPALPTLAQAIGIPFGTALSLQVVPGPAHIVALPGPLVPVATQSIEEDGLEPVDGIPAQPRPVLALIEDASIYAGTAPYPAELARVANDGVIRQQRIAGIAIHPVQYNPAARELTVYESLTVTVTFARSPSGELAQPAASFQPVGAESAAYEELFRSQLLNYESARPWRQATIPSTGKDVESLAAPGVEAQAEVAGTDALAAEPLEIEALPWAPPSPGWRVTVRDEGFYRLTYAELQAAGLPVATLDPATLRLFNLGSEVAIEVSGEADGKFGAEDTLVFYGQAVSSKYTRDNVYWLTYGGALGLRMAARNGAPDTGSTPAYYEARRTLESNATYASKAPGADDLERWLWYQINTVASRPSWSTTFSLPARYAGQYPEARLTVVMLGYLQNAVNPDHHVRVLLNGTQVADPKWDGITWYTLDVPIAQSLLVAGTNTLQVTAANDTDAGSEVVYIDRAELHFANTFRAEGDVLAFDYAAGTWQFPIDGFTSNQIVVYDVTDPAAVAQITGVAVTGSGPYSVLFQDTRTAAARYWTTASFKTVAAIQADTASNLRSTDNGADHITITHSAFAAQAATLSARRAAQGLRAVVVDVQDIYDEFGYGMVGAAPIRAFLAYAFASWQAPAPSFVVLLGDGHYDPKNYLGYGRTNYVPGYLAAADPWIVETAADNRYVTLAGDDTMPDMMLGRLAVNSAAEATAFVDKIIAYETSPAADWQQQVLAIADNADSAGNFAQLSDNLLRDELPAPYVASKVHYLVTHSTLTDARSAIQAGINDGKLLVNYIGHAGISIWADGAGLFKVADVPLLTNAGKYPVLLAMTCYEGSYHYPYPSSSNVDALAEVVTRTAAKGAVASWSPTGLGVATGHDYLNRGFFRAAFTTGVGTVGEATQAGKLNLWNSGGGLDLLDTYLLFGDPATRLPTASCTPPEAVNQVWIALVAANQVELTWAAVAATASGSTIQYQVWWSALDPYFTPAAGAACTEENGCALTPDLVFPHDGAGNTAANYTYLVRPAADCGAVCATLSNRTGEFDFALVPGG